MKNPSNDKNDTKEVKKIEPKPSKAAENHNKNSSKGSGESFRKTKLFNNEIDLQDIAKLEAEKKRLTELLSQGTAPANEIAEYSQQIGKVINELDEKSLRWLELSELL